MRVRLLLVDDDKNMVDILTRFIRPVASVVDSAANLDTALQMARTNSYNIVLLDLRLETTGKEQAFEAIPEFKRRGAAVVVVSGIPDPTLEAQSKAAGANAFVSKDNNFGEKAMLLASYAASMQVPKESYRSGSYWDHVELLKNLAETA